MTHRTDRRGPTNEDEGPDASPLRGIVTTTERFAAMACEEHVTCEAGEQTVANRAGSGGLR